MSTTLSTTMLDTSVAAAERWDDGPGAWWPIFPALWLLVIVGIVVAVMASRRRNSRLTGLRAGETRLAERFAAGEIGEQEYRERRSVVKEQSR